MTKILKHRVATLKLSVLTATTELSKNHNMNQFWSEAVSEQTLVDCQILLLSGYKYNDLRQCHIFPGLNKLQHVTDPPVPYNKLVSNISLMLSMKMTPTSRSTRFTLKSSS